VAVWPLSGEVSADGQLAAVPSLRRAWATGVSHTHSRKALNFPLLLLSSPSCSLQGDQARCRHLRHYGETIRVGWRVASLLLCRSGRRAVPIAHGMPKESRYPDVGAEPYAAVPRAENRDVGGFRIPEARAWGVLPPSGQRAQFR